MPNPFPVFLPKANKKAEASFPERSPLFVCSGIRTVRRSGYFLCFTLCLRSIGAQQKQVLAIPRINPYNEIIPILYGLSISERSLP